MHVLIVAHGPAAVTKAAVRRVRRWGPLVESIAVVPASPVSTPPEVPGAYVIPVMGSAGVRGALEAFDADAPVLMIHDDAALSRRGSIRMLDALESSDFVVPYSNEQAEGTYMGPLPPVADVGVELDGPAPVSNRVIVPEARFAVIMSTAGALADLGGSLVMPGSNLTRATCTISVAPCVAAHDLSCNDRLLADGPDDRPLLVASMIVRDEEKTLGPALESLLPIVDRIEVCDTGSVDGTVDLARRFGASISSIEWRDDFAWARNQALRGCLDARFAVLIDADERVEIDDPVVFRRWLRTWQHEMDGILVMVDSERGGGELGTASISTRIARPRSTFDGAIHERLTVASDMEDADARLVIYRGMRVRHTGYRPEVIASKNKAERNLRIARTVLAHEGTVKAKLDLARSLRMEDPDDPEAEALFREVLDEIGDSDAGTGTSFVFAVVGAYEMSHGRLDEAVRLAERALEITAGEDVALATLGQVLMRRGEHARLVEAFDRLERRNPGNPMFSIRRNVLRYRACVARSMVHVDRLDEAVAMMIACLGEDAIATGELIGPGVPDLLASGVHADRLLDMLVADGSNNVLDAFARALRPADTGAMCFAALTRGCVRPEVYTTLFTVAALTGDTALMAAAGQYRRLVDPDSVEALRDVAARRRPEMGRILDETARVSA